MSTTESIPLLMGVVGRVHVLLYKLQICSFVLANIKLLVVLVFPPTISRHFDLM